MTTTTVEDVRDTIADSEYLVRNGTHPLELVHGDELETLATASDAAVDEEDGDSEDADKILLALEDRIGEVLLRRVGAALIAAGCRAVLAQRRASA